MFHPSKVAFHHNSSLGWAAITHQKRLPDGGHDFLSKLKGSIGHWSWHRTSKHYTHTQKLASVFLSFLHTDFFFSQSLLTAFLPNVFPLALTKKRIYIFHYKNMYILCGAPSQMQVHDFAVAQLGHSHNVTQLPGVGVSLSLLLHEDILHHYACITHGHTSSTLPCGSSCTHCKCCKKYTYPILNKCDTTK